MFKWWKITSFGTLLVLGLFIWIFVFGISANRAGYFFNKGHNAIWIGHEWVGEAKNSSEIIKLVNDLKTHDIDTVFVHAGPLKGDGSIDPDTYKYAIQFVEEVKKIDKNIQYQAWLGQIRSKIDLADSEVRHNIAKQAMILGQLVGFDGIHFDIEPIWDEDKDFIKVLAETREILPQEKKISVAMADFIPSSLIWLLEKIYTFENYNTEVNYENVAKYADQIVVMTYDAGASSEWLYKWRVQEQTIWLTNLLRGKEVFIGIPAYEGELLDERIENLENGLLGVIKGLNNFRSDEENFAGVAIYPYWEIDEKEWKVYKELWMK